MDELRGTNVYSPIVPGTDKDTYPTHYAKFGKGGYVSVLTLEDRNSIPTERLENGCKVYVDETDLEYRYKNGQWIPLSHLYFDITTLDEYERLENKSQNTLYLCMEKDTINKLFIGSIPIDLNAPILFLLDSGILDRDLLG